jgi:hypothetical protein
MYEEIVLKRKVEKELGESKSRKRRRIRLRRKMFMQRSSGFFARMETPY